MKQRNIITILLTCLIAIPVIHGDQGAHRPFFPDFGRLAAGCAAMAKTSYGQFKQTAVNCDIIAQYPSLQRGIHDNFGTILIISGALTSWSLYKTFCGDWSWKHAFRRWHQTKNSAPQTNEGPSDNGSQSGASSSTETGVQSVSTIPIPALPENFFTGDIEVLIHNNLQKMNAETLLRAGLKGVLTNQFLKAGNSIIAANGSRYMLTVEGTRAVPNGYGDGLVVNWYGIIVQVDGFLPLMYTAHNKSHMAGKNMEFALNTIISAANQSKHLFFSKRREQDGYTIIASSQGKEFGSHSYTRSKIACPAYLPSAAPSIMQPTFIIQPNVVDVSEQQSTNDVQEYRHYLDLKSL